jgi:hypothetical protein
VRVARVIKVVNVGVVKRDIASAQFLLTFTTL